MSWAPVDRLYTISYRYHQYNLREESYIGWSGFRAFAPRPVCPPAWVLTTKLVRNSRTPQTILGVGVTQLHFVKGMSASFVLLT